MIQGDCRLWKRMSTRSLLKPPYPRPPYGSLPGGRAPAPAQDDLHEPTRRPRSSPVTSPLAWDGRGHDGSITNAGPRATARTTPPAHGPAGRLAVEATLCPADLGVPCRPCSRVRLEGISFCSFLIRRGGHVLMTRAAIRAADASRVSTGEKRPPRRWP